MSESREMLQGVAPLTLVIPGSGQARYVHRNALFDPAEVDAATVERLVGRNFLRRVRVDADGMVTPLGDDGGASKDAPVESAGGAPQAGPVDSGDTDPEVLHRRAAAAAKLPPDGSMPRHTHGEDVWVEYAVRDGVDRGEAERLGKAGLIRHYRETAKAGTSKPDGDEQAKVDAKADDDAELQSLRERGVKQGMDSAEVAKASLEDLRATVK